MNLASQLRYFRKKLGLSQREMAEKLKVSFSLYSKLEVNATGTTQRRVDNFASLLNTTTEFLLRGTGLESLPQNDPPSPRLTDELLERILTLASDPEVKAASEKIAQATGRTSLQTMVILVKAMILGDD